MENLRIQNGQGNMNIKVGRKTRIFETRNGVLGKSCLQGRQMKAKKVEIC